MPRISYYDISQELAPETAVFPGDTPFSFRFVMTMAGGGSSDVGTVTMSVHTGTHADAPGHFLAQGEPIGRVPLSAYLGPARVVALPLRDSIRPEHLEGLPVAGAERLLFATGSAPDPTRFNRDFAYLSPEAAELLGSMGLKLVGLDTPSMDPWDSKALAAHKRLARHGVAILENLVLSHVPPGDYELVALPLKLRDLEASPVRAILLPPRR